MNIIKTPTGIIPVDEVAKVLTQAQYNALSENEKKNGTYYIIDDDNESLMDIIGTRNISNIAGNVKDAIYLLNNYLKIVAFDATLVNISNNSNNLNFNYKYGDTSNTLCTLRNGRELVFKESGLYEISADIVIYNSNNEDEFTTRIITNNTTYVAECFNSANLNGETSLNCRTIINVNKDDYLSIDLRNISGSRGSVYTDKSLITIRRVLL